MDSDLDDATTWRDRLDLSGQVVALEMRINCDRYATRAASSTVYTLADCISRIELLKDATTPLVSLSAEQLDAVNYWDLKRPNARRYRQEASTGNDLILFLMGGRSLSDTEYGWDFDRLSKVYLEYTYDLNEGDAEYFKANDHDLKIYAWQWKGDGVTPFRSYIRRKQLDAWTTTADGAEHKVEIPAVYPIRRVAIQGKSDDTTLGGAFSDAEVRVDKGAYSPVIIKSPMDWAMQEVAEYGLHNEIGGIDYAVSTGENEIPRWWSYYETLQASPYGYAGEINLETHFITLPGRIKANTTGNQEFNFVSRGWGFQKCLRIGFDHHEDGRDLLRVPSGKALDLIVTEAAASKSLAVFVEDVVGY
jgi:hypothetical protein